MLNTHSTIQTNNFLSILEYGNLIDFKFDFKNHVLISTINCLGYSPLIQFKLTILECAILQNEHGNDYDNGFSLQFDMDVGDTITVTKNVAKDKSHTNISLSIKKAKRKQKHMKKGIAGSRNNDVKDSTVRYGHESLMHMI